MTAHDSDVIGEGANVDLLAEACLIGLGFQGLDLVANALIGSAVLPFRDNSEPGAGSKKKSPAGRRG